MYSIITGSVLLSILHAAIPNHWLPVVAIGRREQWSTSEVVRVTITAAIAHALSTMLIGVVLGVVGGGIAAKIDTFTRYIASFIFILLGLVFIYRHHSHHHFEVKQGAEQKHSKRRIIIALVIAMFFSPCMEIEAYFLMAGTYSLWLVIAIAAMYLSVTTAGMAVLVWFAYQGTLKRNLHALEHRAGIVAGVTLIITGIVSFFVF